MQATVAGAQASRRFRAGPPGSGQTRQHTLGDMVFEELPIVATETTVRRGVLHGSLVGFWQRDGSQAPKALGAGSALEVATKRLIRKETLARTAQKTAAKKKPAKKAAKKPKAKKAKKAKKPKAKKKKKKKKKKVTHQGDWTVSK